MNPMYLAYDPPLMLPTITMNPTATATSTSTASAKAKREYTAEDEFDLPLNKYSYHNKRDNDESRYLPHPNLVWWMGIGMSLLGGVAYLLWGTDGYEKIDW